MDPPTPQPLDWIVLEHLLVERRHGATTIENSSRRNSQPERFTVIRIQVWSDKEQLGPGAFGSRLLTGCTEEIEV